MKKLLYYFSMLLMLLVFRANACSDHDEAAAGALDYRFAGQWCVTHISSGQTDTDMSKQVSAYWDILVGYSFTMHQAPSGTTATFSKGTLKGKGNNWTQIDSELSLTPKSIDLLLYKGSFGFVGDNMFFIKQTDGTKITFERIQKFE